jgi:hypothetical protein
MNQYKCFGPNGKQIDVYAHTSYDAQKQAAEAFKCKSYKVTPMLVETADDLYLQKTEAL